jgi:uncharacterized protein with NRDE domain
MCLIVFRWKNHPDFKLILAANRDEFYARPSERIHFWEQDQDILAGRDMQGGGTWMGVSRKGRFAALTNFRDPFNIKSDAPSRGHLVKEFLTCQESPHAYLKDLAGQSDQYNGFNLLVGDADQLLYFSNYNRKISILEPGIYGLSNHLLNTPWPKVKTAVNRLKSISDSALNKDELFGLMRDENIFPDEALPKTGIPMEWERAVSAIFIRKLPDYGTVNSTLLTVSHESHVALIERIHGPDFSDADERHHSFTVG